MTDDLVRLRVTEALAKDMGHGFARVGPEDLARLGLGVGDTVEVEGKRITMCRVMLAYEDVRGQSRVQLDGITRDNARVGLDDYVTLRRRRCAHAEQIHAHAHQRPAVRAGHPVRGDPPRRAAPRRGRPDTSGSLREPHGALQGEEDQPGGASDRARLDGPEHRRSRRRSRRRARSRTRTSAD